MRQFGELKGYQGDIKGKALVDYVRWLLPKQDKMYDLSNLVWSHESAVIRNYFSDEMKDGVKKMEKLFDIFWKEYTNVLEQTVKELELTERELELWEGIWEYKDIWMEDKTYSWDSYVESFKEYMPVLENLTEKDNRFVKFWLEGYK